MRKLLGSPAFKTEKINVITNKLNEIIMTKKETVKWIVQIIASVATAILTALGATSCMGY